MAARAICPLIAAAMSLILSACAATYHEDCTLRLKSDPAGAEVWKHSFFLGLTPLDLNYTVTSEIRDRGYLRIPPITIRKEGYKPYHLETELDIGEGLLWEAFVPLEPAAPDEQPEK